MTHSSMDLDRWWAEYAEHYEGRTWKHYRNVLAEFVLYAEESPLLDVGCGYGFLLECARRFGVPAIGVEGSESAIARGWSLHPLVDIRAWHAGEDLPFRSNFVGGAVLNEFIDHIGIAQNELLFRELWRVLKPGGTLIVKSPSKFNRRDQDAGHVTFFSASEFCEFVRSFSFEVLHQPYIPRPVLGESKVASLGLKLVTKAYKADKWAARIDLVARKRRDRAPYA
jgi:SAM-dependent methyltransferase